MRHILTCLLAMAGWCLATAQTVDAVVVESSTVVDCKDMRNTRTTERRVYRLLHDRVADLAELSLACSKWEKLSEFSGQVTDADGKVLRKFKKGDLKRTDVGSNFADDYHTMYLDYSPPAFPVTVEFNWVIDENDGCFGFPRFAPMPAYNTQVEHASYTLTVPAEMGCRYRCCNTTVPVTETTLPDGRVRYEAHMDNLPVIESEPFDPPSREVVPMILWAPCRFTFHGTSGDMTTWDGFGRWLQQLRQGRLELTPEFKAQLHAMTDTCRDTRGKVAVLYRYLGESTRYVSIQLGIGGWQPFPAAEVCRTRFGDCKGLSNYMCAMLREVGVPANYVVIASGRPRLFTDFPSNQFNHAIVQVPLSGDTLWLECTASSVMPLGHIHQGIAGGDALVVTDEGGVMCRLPGYTPEQNLQYSTALITLNTDGSAAVDITQRNERAQYEDILPLKRRTEQQRRDAMLRRVRVPMATLTSFDFTEHKDAYQTPHIDVTARVESRKLAGITGSRMFVPMDIFHDVTVPRSVPERRHPVDVTYSYLDVDSVVITLPEGFELESIPGDLDQRAPMGQLTRTATRHGNVITVVTRLRMQQGRYPASDYDALRNLKTRLQKAYTDRIALKRKN